MKANETFQAWVLRQVAVTMQEKDAVDGWRTVTEAEMLTAVIGRLQTLLLVCD
jgi:hypothetical protein